jgi:hypothetical protein
MAHFAELDSNNVVLRVIVVDNKDTADAYGVEKEHIGAAFCERVLGGNWKQTSYNGTKRKNYAGIGYKYHADIDAFAAPQPYASWTLDANAIWQPPVAMPTDGTMESSYTWDEATTSWIRSPS